MDNGKISLFRQKSVLFVFGACVFLGALLSGSFSQSKVTEAPATLEVDRADLDLGDVWLQRELAFRFSVRNPSESAIQVGQLSASCNCTELTPSSFIVPPHGETAVSGTIDLTRSVQETDADREPFGVVLTADITAPNSDRVEWQLRGVAKRALEMSPNRIVLQGADEVVHETFSPTVEVAIKPHVAISEILPEWNANEAHLDLSGPDEEGGWLLAYMPIHDLPLGKIATRVNLRVKWVDGTFGPDLEIPVTGVVVPPVRLSPEQITLANIPSAKTDSPPRTVSVIARDRGAWNVVKLLDVPEWLDIVNDSESSHIRLDVARRVDAEKRCQLRVLLESSQGNRAELSLKVSLTPASGAEVVLP